MPPGGGTETSRVVVRVTRPHHAIRRDVVPFLAGNFTSLTADTDRRVRKEADGRVFLHIRMTSLIGMGDAGSCVHLQVLLLSRRSCFRDLVRARLHDYRAEPWLP